MYVSVVPSGCAVRNGMVQIRFGCYLASDDYAYNTHYVYVMVSEDPEVWEWQNNPFHNHFIYTEPDISDEDILKEADKWCKAAYKCWKKEDPIELKNDKIKWPDPITEGRIASCELLVAHLEVTPLSSEVEKEKEKK